MTSEPGGPNKAPESNGEKWQNLVEFIKKNNIILSIIGTIISLFGFYLAINNYLIEQPRLSTNIERIELKSAISFKKNDFIYNLQEIISDKNGEYKAEYFNLESIQKILDEVAEIPVGEEPTSEILEDINHTLDGAIVLFDINNNISPEYIGIENLQVSDREYTPEEKIQELIYNLEDFQKDLQSEFSIFTRNESKSLILDPFIDDLNDIQEEYQQYTDREVINLMNTLENLKNTILFTSNYKEIYSESISTFIEQLSEAINKFNVTKDELPNIRGKILDQLIKTKSYLQSLTNSENSKLVMNLTVENQSKLPNFLLSTALLKVYKDSESGSKDIALTFSASSRQETVLSGFSVGSFILESKRFSLLDDETRDFIQKAFEQEYKCLLILEDFHRKIYHAQGVISELQLLPAIDRLKQEAAYIFLRIA
jgi:hypothetical protein